MQFRECNINMLVSRVYVQIYNISTEHVVAHHSYSSQEVGGDKWIWCLRVIYKVPALRITQLNTECNYWQKIGFLLSDKSLFELQFLCTENITENGITLQVYIIRTSFMVDCVIAWKIELTSHMDGPMHTLMRMDDMHIMCFQVQLYGALMWKRNSSLVMKILLSAIGKPAK